MTPDVRVIRDNLNVGLYLSHSRFGATLENILQTALGFDLGRGHLREDFVRRFRNAQAVEGMPSEIGFLDTLPLTQCLLVMDTSTKLLGSFGSIPRPVNPKRFPY